MGVIQQFFLDTIKYFTELNSEKALRFGMGALIIYLFIGHNSAIKTVNANLLACEHRTAHLITERDSIFTLRYKEHNDEMQARLTLMEKVLAETEKNKLSVDKISNKIQRKILNDVH